MDMRFDACINYQYCMCIYDQDTDLSDAEKFERICTNIKKAFPESIRYDSVEAYNDEVFKDLHTVEGFLHGGGLPFKNNRIHIKGLDLKFEKVQMKESGIELCIVSNSRKRRVPEFCEKYGLSCVTRSKKPFSKGILECMRRFDRKPGECALVGDQIYTDVLGANCAGVYSVLTKAIHNHNIWLKLRHVAELPFIYVARKRRM